MASLIESGAAGGVTGDWVAAGCICNFGMRSVRRSSLFPQLPIFATRLVELGTCVRELACYVAARFWLQVRTKSSEWWTGWVEK